MFFISRIPSAPPSVLLMARLVLAAVAGAAASLAMMVPMMAFGSLAHHGVEPSLVGRLVHDYGHLHGVAAVLVGLAALVLMEPWRLHLSSLEMRGMVTLVARMVAASSLVALGVLLTSLDAEAVALASSGGVLNVHVGALFVQLGVLGLSAVWLWSWSRRMDATALSILSGQLLLLGVMAAGHPTHAALRAHGWVLPAGVPEPATVVGMGGALVLLLLVTRRLTRRLPSSERGLFLLPVVLGTACYALAMHASLMLPFLCLCAPERDGNERVERVVFTVAGALMIAGMAMLRQRARRQAA